jgi:hypothetical protein
MWEGHQGTRVTEGRHVYMPTMDGHLQTLGVVVQDAALPPLLCAPWLAGT